MKAKKTNKTKWKTSILHSKQGGIAQLCTPSCLDFSLRMLRWDFSLLSFSYWINLMEKYKSLMLPELCLICVISSDYLLPSIHFFPVWHPVYWRVNMKAVTSKITEIYLTSLRLDHIIKDFCTRPIIYICCQNYKLK